MDSSQRAALRSLVKRLLPDLGRERMLELLAARMAGTASHPALEEPALAPLWQQPAALGWAYQYAQEGLKDAIFHQLLQQGQKVTAKELPAVTQLFTPEYIAQFLVENSLGRRWLEMHPDSALRWKMRYLAPAVDLPVPSTPLSPTASATSHSPSVSPTLPCSGTLPSSTSRPVSVIPSTRPAVPALAHEIRVLDPACGAMHLGLAVYDLLVRCYAEELVRAGQPGWPDAPSVGSAAEIPAAILSQNLYGADIDPGVLAVARQVLRLKAGVEPVHLACLSAPLGSLDCTAGPQGLFHVVVTNPPYMARKNGETALAAYLESTYPEGKGDLYTAFLQRSLEWLAPGGRLAVVAQSSFMFIGTYEPLRRWLLDRVAIETVAHLGPGAFAEIGGEKVNTAAFILRREDEPKNREEARGHYIRLLDGGEEEKRQALATATAITEADAAETVAPAYKVPQAAFCSLPGAPWVYWIPPELQVCYQAGERLGDRVRFCRGITTADNRRFVRYWWEVGLEAIAFGCRSTAEAAKSPMRWFPYMKGGAGARWFSHTRYVLDWAGGGRELRTFPRGAVRNLPFQFRAGVTYSSVTGGSMTARQMVEGFLFDQASNALFPLDEADTPLLLALLNHPIAAFTVGFNPTVNIVEADLNRIPWPQVERPAVAERVAECVGLAEQIDAMDELSPRFQQPPLPDESDLIELHRRLARAEAELEALIDEGLGLTSAGRASIRERGRSSAPLATTLMATPGEGQSRIDSWISYGLGILLGRCHPGSYGGGQLLVERWPALEPLVRSGLAIPVAKAEAALEDVLSVLLGDLRWDGGARRTRAELDLTAFLRRHSRTYRGRPVFILEDGAVCMNQAHRME